MPRRSLQPRLSRQPEGEVVQRSVNPFQLAVGPEPSFIAHPRIDPAKAFGKEMDMRVDGGEDAGEKGLEGLVAVLAPMRHKEVIKYNILVAPRLEPVHRDTY